MTTTGKQPLHWALQTLDTQFWLRHALFWTVRTLLMVAIFLYSLHTTPHWRLALRDALLLLPPCMLATYTLVYGVLPLLWRKNKRGWFLLLLVVWFVAGLALTFAHRYYILIPEHYNRPSPFADYHIVFATGAHMPLLLTAGVAACLHVYRQWHRKALDNTQLTQQNYQAELQLLKAQLHPHFLFNTLNNLYALTLRQSDQAPVVVERLTGLLHFVVKQSNAPLVTLSDEVALLRNYLALEQLRYGQRLTLELLTGPMPAMAHIAPLLLLPLVENAFKHGSAEQLGETRIRVALAVEGRQFSCVIANTKSTSAAPATGPAGIGLRNVRQRLALLYPHQHRLDVEAGADTFSVRLTLQLPETEASPVLQPVTLPPRLARPAVPASLEPAISAARV